MTVGTAFWVVAFSYLVGSIPWGLLIGKFNGLDIRRHGSGNIGATNVRRVLGRDWGFACFGLDFLKGLTPVLLCQSWTGDGNELAGLLAAAAAVCGRSSGISCDRKIFTKGCRGSSSRPRLKCSKAFGKSL